jgi:hypothetical protein
MVAHACNTSTWKDEFEAILGYIVAPGQSGPHSTQEDPASKKKRPIRNLSSFLEHKLEATSKGRHH